MTVYHITDKFISHLDSLERMLTYNSKIIEDEIKKKRQDLNMYELIHLIINVKVLDLADEDQIDEDLYIKFLEDKKFIEDNMDKEIIRFLYKNIVVRIEDDDEVILIENGYLQKVFTDTSSEAKNIHTDIVQTRHSLIISLVSSFELLIGDLLKYFILNVDESNFLNNRSVKFSDLLIINDVNEARSFLVDRYIEELLRGTFSSWMNEIENKMKIKIIKHDEIKKRDAIELINETFQRRHLLVHNDGIINDLYISNTVGEMRKGIKKGSRIRTDDDYIVERIKIFRKVGIILVYLFSMKIYRNEEDEFFNDFNNILLPLACKGCLGARYIYNSLSKNNELKQRYRLMSKINYFLSYKLNNEFELVKQQVDSFDVESLSTEYKMAKSILLDDVEESFTFFKEYVNNDGEDQFFHIIDWPLIRLVREESIFKEFIREKTQELLDIKEEDLSEDFATIE